MYNANTTLTNKSFVGLVLSPLPSDLPGKVQALTDADLDLIENNLGVYIQGGGARVMGYAAGATRRSARTFVGVDKLRQVLAAVKAEQHRRVDL